MATDHLQLVDILRVRSSHYTRSVLAHMAIRVALTCLWFIPETPRWYVVRGRREDARRCSSKLFGGCAGYDLDKEVSGGTSFGTGLIALA